MQARFYFSVPSEKTLGIWFRYNGLSRKHQRLRIKRAIDIVRLVTEKNYRNFFLLNWPKVLELWRSPEDIKLHSLTGLQVSVTRPN